MSGGGWPWRAISIMVVVLVAVFLARWRKGDAVAGTGSGTGTAAAWPARSAAALNPQPVPPAHESVADESPMPRAVSDEPSAPAADAGPSIAERAEATAAESAATDGRYVAGPEWTASAPSPAGAGPALAMLAGGVAGLPSVSPGSGAAAVVGAVATQAGPYPGSALPTADGSSPSGEYTIKGNAGSNRYHTADSPYFYRTRAEVWFSSAADAEAAGFAPWNGRPAGT